MTRDLFPLLLLHTSTPEATHSSLLALPIYSADVKTVQKDYRSSPHSTLKVADVLFSTDGRICTINLGTELHLFCRSNLTVKEVQAPH